MKDKVCSNIIQKIFVFVVAILLFCFLFYISQKQEALTAPETTSETTTRQTIIMNYTEKYEVNSESVYWFDRLEKPSISIDDNYRQIEPVANPDFDKITNEIRNKDYFEYLELGNLFVPYLLCEESLSKTDNEYIQAVERENLKLFVFSMDSTQYHHRFFLFSSVLDAQIGRTLPSYCFVQSWNDYEIRAQPIFEALWYSFDKEVFYALPEAENKTQLLLYGGNADDFLTGNHGPLKPAILAWEWEDEAQVWAPMNFPEEMAVDYMDSDLGYIYIYKDGMSIDKNYYNYEINMCDPETLIISDIYLDKIYMKIYRPSHEQD